MKKLLLTLVFAVIALCAAAATTTITAPELTVPGETAINGFTIDIQKGAGATAPQVYQNTVLRSYAKNTIVIKGKSLTKIVFQLNATTAKRLTDLVPSTGKIEPAQAAGDTEITWVGDAAEVTFTVGEKAVYGTEGDTKAGQVHIDAIVIEGAGVSNDYAIEASELSVAGPCTVQGFDFDIQKGTGSTAPAYNAGTSAVRLYANNTMAVSAKKLTKITIQLASDAAARYTTLTPSTGTIEPAQAVGDTEVTWVGEAETVTFTVGEKATLGTDGESKAGQLRFTSLLIEGTPNAAEAGNGTAEYLLENDANGLEGWTIDNGTLPEGITAIWAWKAYNNKYYLNASAYKEKALPSDAYAISPVIDLNGATAPTFSFDHAAKFQTTLKELCYAAIREEGATAWTKLEIPTWPEAGGWTFANSGEIDLAAYVGKKVEIAFHYGSTDAGADTWEIKNMKVTGVAGGGTTVEPEKPVTVTFTLATAIESGKKYVFAAGGKVATPLAGNYGYLPMADATFNGNTCETEEANAFTITKVEGTDTYTIFANDKYYYMKGTYNSFNVDATMPETGATWTISVAADGKATITNVEMSKTISYSAQYTSYGSYAEVGENELPTLYVLGGSTTAVENIAVDANAPVEYFNLQGIRIANPENGIYIRRQGNKVSKVIIR